MRFFWVKLHIECAFHYSDHYGSGVTYPWIFYCRTYACYSFPGFFLTSFHIGTWTFLVKLHIEFTFNHHDFYFITVVPEYTRPWIFYYRTYACNSFPSPKVGPLVMPSITPASSSHNHTFIMSVLCCINRLVLALAALCCLQPWIRVRSTVLCKWLTMYVVSTV
jgi:hypothetical protein